MRRTIALDGEWERRDFLDEAWRWSDALAGANDVAAGDGPPAKAGISSGWRTARVPGSAIDDAWRGGEVPNPYVDRASLGAEWVPERTWVYRRGLVADPSDGERATLRFEGIDPSGTVFLDGTEVARHDGMFLPLEVDLTGRLRRGAEHRLAVVVDRAPQMPSQVGRSELARHHRSRMGYGWDFCPRMVHTGIWRSVTLDLYRARLGQPRLAIELASDHARATVTVRVATEGDVEGAHVTARVTDEHGIPAASDEAGTGTEPATLRLGLDRPELWWPNGIGAAHRYRLELVLERDGQRLDERSVWLGVRSVAFAPTAGAQTGARHYTVVVNGRPTWIRGWNWVPIDAAYGVPRPDRLANLVELARRANVNLLRVWGGGLIESDAFYDACDAAGIMVWQEFAQSSSGLTNAPPDDAEFVARMRREAEAIIPLRAHHPSLVLWCGGNELAGRDGPLDERHPVLGALADVVQREDPDRLWLPTSPSGPRFDNSLSAIAEDPASLHDVHGPWEHQGLREQHTLADAGTSLLHSEFGTEEMTNPDAFAATVSAEHRTPHDRSNAVLAHRGAWWINAAFVRAAFGAAGADDLTDVELWRASQHLQADGLRTLVEGDRRRWPRNAGALPWQLNEPFPNAWCTSAVDAFGTPKAAYWAVAEAYAPLAVLLGFDSQALDGAGTLGVRPTIVNDGDRPISGALELVLHDANGRRLATAAFDIIAPANAVASVPEVPMELPARADGLLILDATFDTAHTRRLLSCTADLAPFRRLAPTTVEVAVDAEADCWMLRLRTTGRTAALDLRLADARAVGWPERRGHAYLDRNGVTMLPGEDATIRVDWRDVAPADRRMTLSGWNIDERTVMRG
jgi:beta-mannosidase